MKLLFTKIIIGLLFFSLTAETATHLFKNSDPIYMQAEKEDPEKKSEENKIQKEDEKDKITFFFNHNLPSDNAGILYERIHSVTTSAYLSLPEIPPDQV